jgi:hypothetical protein
MFDSWLVSTLPVVAASFELIDVDGNVTCKVHTDHQAVGYYESRHRAKGYPKTSPDVNVLAHL